MICRAGLFGFRIFSLAVSHRTTAEKKMYHLTNLNLCIPLRHSIDKCCTAYYAVCTCTVSHRCTEGKKKTWCAHIIQLVVCKSAPKRDHGKGRANRAAAWNRDCSSLFDIYPYPSGGINYYHWVPFVFKKRSAGNMNTR